MSQRVDRDFESHGLRCAAWLYLPPNLPEGLPTDSPGGDQKPPVVVMAHGFAAERTFRLPAFAEVFAAAGLAVLVFDYRNFGDSEGTPRNLVSPTRHIEDWKAAIAYARALDEVDGTRVALWGTSFSGGHVITCAAADHDIRALVAQVPYVGGLEVSMPLSMQVRAGVAIALDKAASLFGGAFCVPAAAKAGEFGCLSSDEALEYLDLIPADSTWENKVPARALLEIQAYQPCDVAGDVECPALLVAGKQDLTTPPDLVKDCASRLPRGEVVIYDCGHFAPYTGEMFEIVSARERDFLVKHLAN